MSSDEDAARKPSVAATNHATPGLEPALQRLSTLKTAARLARTRRPSSPGRRATRARRRGRRARRRARHPGSTNSKQCFPTVFADFTGVPCLLFGALQQFGRDLADDNDWCSAVQLYHCRVMRVKALRQNPPKARLEPTTGGARAATQRIHLARSGQDILLQDKCRRAIPSGMRLMRTPEPRPTPDTIQTSSQESSSSTRCRKTAI